MTSLFTILYLALFTECMLYRVREVQYREHPIAVFASHTGTPSLAGAGLVEAVLKVVSNSAHLDREAEVCLEANPTSANLSQLRWG